MCGLDLPGLRQKQLMGSSERDNEASISIKGGQFRQLSDC